MVEFIPKLGNEKHFGAWSWWWASPQIYVNLLTILGFKEFQLSTAKHLHADSGNKIELYTLVATR
jgi:hypothetical protein